ncbi:MAG: WXG100 family type VII secretion target [Deltaproteobacteria bacterium]|nr:WXG100 family type VII secretion target [Deltaproteobacteria bacterium]
MSSQVIASPETMRDFAATLDSANNHLVALMSDLNSRLSYLGDSWRDQHYSDFKDAFEQTARSLNAFLQNADNYSRFLRQKAEALENYGDIRVPY